MITTHVVDLRKEFNQGNRSIFSRLLLQKMNDVLARKQQVILFLNKRGFFSSLTCRQCGFTMKCSACDLPMTYHKETPQRSYMLCHSCGHMAQVLKKCPQCGSPYIKFFGIGTQNIVEQVEEYFPRISVARADRDSTRTKEGFSRVYQDFKDGKISVLVGTQIIAKGLDIENVGLIGIILADVGLHIPDFRSSERTFQLLTQVSGRTGRLGTHGEVILQTYMPEQPAIAYASSDDYHSFYAREIEERKQYQYPPFTHMIKLLYVHMDKNVCHKEAEYVYKELQWNKEHHYAEAGIDIFLSQPCIEKKHNKYHYHIILKGKKHDIRSILSHVQLKKGWKIDVDPISIA